VKSKNQTISVIDQLGREIIIPILPQRIISVVPSQTELLFDLGRGDSVIGVTLFCIHPEEAKSKTKIGGTKKLKLEKIVSLNPDLIIANKEENDQSQIEWLAERFPVWISDIKDMDNALSMIRAVGEMTGRMEQANSIISSIYESFSKLKPGSPRRTLYLIWRSPYMSVGSDTFISHIMQRCGFVSVLDSETRYPELTENQIKTLNPELVLLSSEPYPFKEKHISELKNLLPNAKIMLVDGEMFSWYGSRLVEASSYLKKLLDNEAMR
jgi:ABC-type Fe3+-hydroxamate transport system substrate-binding protein